MQKQAVRRLIFILCLFLPLVTIVTLVTACGTNTLAQNNANNTGNTSSSTGNTSISMKDNLYVLDGYGSSARHIVALHPANASSAQLSLPVGLTSLDHQRLYTTTPRNGQTTIAMINTSTGKTIRSFTISGNYAMNISGYDASDASVLSANGQWLALRSLIQQANTTTIAIVDTQAGKLLKTIHLQGDFTLDALSQNGNSLYLLEKINDFSGHYHVRVYEMDKNSLWQGYITDKTIPNDIMSGTGLTRQMSGDGVISYTLYIDTVHNIAFVHILPLGTDFYGARCIDLPVGKSVDALHYYTLALSADGKTLYAANGALGVVTQIDVSSGEEVFSDKITVQSHFNPGSVNVASNGQTRMLHNGAALSADGNMLYFAGVHGVWAVNTADLATTNRSSVKATYLQQQSVTSVALSSDNRTLYAVDPVHGLTLIDTATGQTQSVSQSAAPHPWGIEWIAR